MDTKPADYHLEETTVGSPKHQMSQDWSDITQDAKEATAAEHSTTFWQGIKLYRKAAFWSFIVSMTIIMEGYDTALLGNFYALPAFKEKYGSLQKGSYQISSPWMNMLSYLQMITNIIAAQAAGSLSQRYGYRPLLLSALVLMAGAIFVTFFAPSLPVLLVGELLCGIPWGTFAVLAPAYASEVCPVVLRGYLTAYLNLCWVIGQLINAGVVYGLQDYPGQWSYRIPFAIQWVWVIPLFCLIFLAPESPWWYVRKGRLEDAERSLQRLSQDSAAINTKQMVAMMLHTDNFEKEQESGTSILDCFKGSNLRRTEIACAVYAMQPMTGGAQIPGSYFFEQIGLSVRESFGMGLGATAVAFCTSILAWVVIGFSGRRRMLLSGMAGMVIVLLTIGFLALGPTSTNHAIPWAQGSLALVFNVCYNLSVGTLAFTIFSEVSSTRLRGRTIALAKNVNAASSIVVGVASPYFINPHNLDWKGKVGFFWAGINVLWMVWAYFRLPELKGRTYEEIDILFAQEVKARDFRKHVVDLTDV
ncbi:hypothetical protein H2204_000535 [Knufia peltigerae]|nr:hypothetical protein H2204_000535 [Knufia peltigerae]